MVTVNHNAALPGRDTTSTYEAPSIASAVSALDHLLKRAYGPMDEDGKGIAKKITVSVRIDRT